MQSIAMIKKPTRREVLKYAGIGAMAFGVPLLLKIKEAKAAFAIAAGTSTATSGTGGVSVTITGTTAGNALIIFGATADSNLSGPTGSQLASGGESLDDYSYAYNSTSGGYSLCWMHYCKKLATGGSKTYTTTNTYDSWVARIIEISGQDDTANFDAKGPQDNTYSGQGTTSLAYVTMATDHAAIFALSAITNNSGDPQTGDYETYFITNYGSPPLNATAMYWLDPGTAAERGLAAYHGNDYWAEAIVAVKLAGAAASAAKVRRGRVF